MTTNTAGSAAQEYHTRQTHFLRYDLTETSALTGTIGILPAGAIIDAANSGVYVNTVFSGGNPTVDIGITGSTTKYASALDLDAALGFVVLDETSGDTLKVTVDTPLIYTLVLDTPVAADGDASIIIQYFPRLG